MVSNFLSSKANIGDFHVVAQYYIPPLTLKSPPPLSFLLAHFF